MRPPEWLGRAVAAGLVLAVLAQPARAVELLVSNERPKQGQTIAVTVRDAVRLTDEAPSVQFNKKRFRLFGFSDNSRADNSQPQLYAMAESASDLRDDAGCVAEISGTAVSVLRTLIAIPADLAPGHYAIRYGDLSKTLAVQTAAFPVQRLRLPRDRAELKPSPGEAEAVAAAKATLSDERRWKGPFHLPTAGRVTARFGLRRVVNGKLLSDYFHSGIDYAAPVGTPVSAAAAGKVILAATGFRLHGNTICLDHGQGVVSFYIHLQKVLVKPGQTVKAGEVIGRVGQSGRASGPHLHFSVYVQQVAANPLYWYSQTF